MAPLARVLTALAVLVGAAVVLVVPSLRAMEAYRPADGPSGRLATDGRVAIACLDGTAAERGRALGTWCAPQIRGLLARMPAAAGDALARFPADQRAELEALAAAAQVDAQRLASANLAMEPGCSVAVALPRDGQPLRIARNMDFAPADLLGGGTLISVARGAGVRSVASVGWPGFVCIVSGINDAGVTACVLVNLDDGVRRDGEPICVRLRHVLERAGTLAEAIAIFRDGAVSSAHFALLADAGDATIAWHGSDGFHSDRATGRWLLATNGARAGGAPQDDRGTRLARETARDGAVDDARLRGLLAGCWLRGLNAQAMLFEPASRRLQLATGGARQPAALGAWSEIDLAPLLRDGRMPEPLSRPVDAAR